MMRLTVFLFFLIFSGCSSATENNAGKVSVETCDITFNMAGPCQYKQITVNMNVEKIIVVYINNKLITDIVTIDSKDELKKIIEAK